MARGALWRTGAHRRDNDRPTGENDHERAEPAGESGESRGERVADGRPPLGGLAVWPVFRVRRPASRPPRGGDHQRVVPGKSVPLRAVKAKIVGCQRERFDRADRAHRLQHLPDFGVRQAGLARGHHRELGEHRHAEEAALGQYRLGAIRLVARGQAIKTGESSFQEIALMHQLQLMVRLNEDRLLRIENVK